MSKQHLADMLKSIANDDADGAKAHFSKYASEKTQEILSRNELPEEETKEPEAAPAVEPTDVPPADDTTK